MAHPHVDIERRQVKLDFSAAPVARWSQASPAFESAHNVLSHFFPPGEAFFIMSVRNYLDAITDPALKDETERFIFQESMHSRVHASCNHALDKVDATGVHVARIAGIILNFVRKTMPHSSQLATSCALEHFTALFADGLLRSQDHVMQSFDPAFAALWLWHAAEETEHKGVCFDVYQHCCGRGPIAYLQRTSALFLTTVIFVVVLAYAFLRIGVDKDQAPAACGGKRKSRISMVLGWLPLKDYFAYYKPGFHPWDHDNRDLLERWKQAYPEFGLGKEAAAPA